MMVFFLISGAAFAALTVIAAWWVYRKTVSPTIFGLWLWGAALIFFVGWVLIVVISAASCHPIMSEKELTLSSVTDWCKATAPIYLIMTEWQSGVGVIIGSLGLAWSTFYTSVSKLKEAEESLAKANEKLNTLRPQNAPG